MYDNSPLCVATGLQCSSPHTHMLSLLILPWFFCFFTFDFGSPFRQEFGGKFIPHENWWIPIVPTECIYICIALHIYIHINTGMVDFLSTVSTQYIYISVTNSIICCIYHLFVCGKPSIFVWPPHWIVFFAQFFTVHDTLKLRYASPIPSDHSPDFLQEL